LGGGQVRTGTNVGATRVFLNQQGRGGAEWEKKNRGRKKTCLKMTGVVKKLQGNLGRKKAALPQN